MRSVKRAIPLFLLLLTTCVVLGQDEEKTVPYFQSGGFNVPRLEGWVDQSSEDIAQFSLAEAAATIRTRIVDEKDVLAGVRAELEDWLGARDLSEIYRGKVNLADGTWMTLAFDVDEAATVSVMARALGEKSVVLSFVERDPEARVVMVTVAKSDESSLDAANEIAFVVEAVTGASLGAFEGAAAISLPSGEWLSYASEVQTAMGMDFGNDSYVALAQGGGIDLPALADAYNRSILGFFVTPDNTGYLALALAAVFVILGGLIFSFYWRWRNLRQDLAMLARLRAD